MVIVSPIRAVTLSTLHSWRPSNSLPVTPPHAPRKRAEIARAPKTRMLRRSARIAAGSLMLRKTISTQGFPESRSMVVLFTTEMEMKRSRDSSTSTCRTSGRNKCRYFWSTRVFPLDLLDPTSRQILQPAPKHIWQCGTLLLMKTAVSLG